MSGSTTLAAPPTRVAFLSRHAWPWFRQTEDGAGHHQGLTFGLIPSEDDDWIVVFDDISSPVSTRVPSSRRILFVTEPPGQKVYEPETVNQFGILVSGYPIEGFRGQWVAGQPGINWFYGIAFGEERSIISRCGLSELHAMPVPADKARRVSVVCSTKKKLPGHRSRSTSSAAASARSATRPK
jgi:hypothetical protein